MKSSVIVFALLLSALTGCEKVVYLPLEETDRRIVLSGLLCPDSIVVVGISRTLRVLEGTPPDTLPPPDDTMDVDHAFLYEGNILVGALQPLKNNFYHLPDFKPVPGKSYALQVTVADMKPVTAEVTIPERLVLKSFDTTRVELRPERSAIKISLKIDDPASENNYYAIQVTGTQRYYWDYFDRKIIDSIKTYRFTPQMFGKSDGIMELEILDVNRDLYLDGKLLFSDQLFNGSVFEMSFEIRQNYWSHMADTVLFGVNIEQIDKSYYEYAVSYRKYSMARGNPFSEPVQVFSNVTDGFGLFSACAGIRKEFIMDWTR